MDISRRSFLSGFVAVAAIAAAGPALGLVPTAPAADYVQSFFGRAGGSYVFSTFIKPQGGNWYRVVYKIVPHASGEVTISLREMLARIDEFGRIRQITSPVREVTVTDCGPGGDGRGFAGMSAVYAFGDRQTTVAMMQLEDNSPPGLLAHGWSDCIAPLQDS